MSSTALPDDLAWKLIERLVAEVDDGESADGAFATAWHELKDRAPEGAGSNRAMADLEGRGWIRVRYAKSAASQLTDPRVAEVLPAGRDAANSSAS